MRLRSVCKCVIEGDRIEAIPATRLCTQHGMEIQQIGDRS